MARLDNALLDGKAFSKDTSNVMLDLTHGGQFAWSPNHAEWINNQAYIRRNLVPIVLEAPKFFQLMDNPEVWVSCFKSLIEKHCRTIDGYQAGLKATFDDHPVGGAGEVHQEVTDMKRDRSEPVFTFIEKYGRPVQTFIEYWMRYGMMDPETKYAMIGTLRQNVPTDLLADWFTGTILVFEPNPLHTKIEKAWITTNFAPQNNGEVIGKRDLTSASEILTLSIPFTGISQYGLGVNKFAQTVLDNIRLANANPFNAPAMLKEIQKDVEAAAKGYKQSVLDLGASAVSPS